MREVVPPALAGERIDRVVALVTGRSRAEAGNLVDRGAVLLDGRPITTRSRRVTAGEVVDVTVEPRAEPSLPAADPGVEVAVVHVDEDVIVVDKPAGLVVHPGAGHGSGTLVNGLLARFPDVAGAGVGDPARPGIVHRLDVGTSGLLVVARTAPAFDALVAQLSARDVERRYQALVLGHVEEEVGLIDAPIGRASSDPTRQAIVAGGREARTRYTVQARWTSPVPTTELDCRLETGRTHQIRVHLAAIGHPVAGDVRYGGSRPAIELTRPYLHAHRLAFDHPRTGERVVFESPLPPDLARFRASLA